jgi:predicted RNA-binding Zn-ribbon protein involved in translation (DUF1610 family)
MSDLLQTLRLLVVSPDKDLSQWLISDLGALEEKDGTHTVEFSGTRFEMVLECDPTKLSSPSADILLGLIRFVDGVSLHLLGELFKVATAEKSCPAAVLVYRKELEGDFKMSCPFCGQKLWVRDADQDKRGRCPNCHKGFTLPGQEDHVAKALHLPPGISVRKAVQGDTSTLGAHLKQLLRVRADEINLRMAGDKTGLSSRQTMNVNLETGLIPPQGH